MARKGTAPLRSPHIQFRGVRIRTRRSRRNEPRAQASGAPASESPLRRGFPQFDGIAFGIVEAGETAVGIALAGDLNGDSRFSNLRHHGIEAANAKIHHPAFVGPEILTVFGKRCEGARAGLLVPRQRVVIARHKVDAETIEVPLAKRFRIASPANSFYAGTACGAS